MKSKDGTAARLTQPQRRALQYLAAERGGRDGLTSPAELGYGMQPGPVAGMGRALKPQGAGRLGGTMGARLVRMGLAEHIWDGQHYLRGRKVMRACGSGYRINEAGMHALKRCEKDISNNRACATERLG